MKRGISVEEEELAKNSEPLFEPGLARAPTTPPATDALVSPEKTYPQWVTNFSVEPLLPKSQTSLPPVCLNLVQAAQTQNLYLAFNHSKQTYTQLYILGSTFRVRDWKHRLLCVVIKKKTTMYKQSKHTDMKNDPLRDNKSQSDTSLNNNHLKRKDKYLHSSG